MMKLQDALAAWRLADGGTDPAIRAALEGGAEGVNRWAVWLRDPTFGFCLDFSCEGSQVLIERPGFDLEDSFTISAFVRVPPREGGCRTVMAGGISRTNRWRLFIDNRTGEPAFEACGLSAQPGRFGRAVNDGAWHHLTVSYDGEAVRCYLDGESVREQTATGKIYVSSYLFFGCDVNGESGLDGSLAEVAFYRGAKVPADVTDTVIRHDLETTEPRMTLKKGLVLDRCQAVDPLPKDPTPYQPWDAECARQLGFDHIKILFTPHHSRGPAGELLVDKLAYITRVVDDVVKAKFPCILCIHPEAIFKTDGLQEGTRFDRQIRWYTEFAEYFKAHWGPDDVALQIMTEPFADTPESRWTWFADRMWGTVRNVLPDHTLITSSDTAGNLERVKAMSPTSDTNLIYSFTTYEPYTIGFNALKAGGDKSNIWCYIRRVRYPVDPGMPADEMAALVEDNAALVPDDKKDEARRYLYAYYRGEYDGHEFFKNHYDLTYNADWNMLRMKSLDNWRKKNGGHIHIMCVEFGCMDEYTARRRFCGVDGMGVDPDTRIRHVGDLRRAFEAFDIGWCYWSYNEAFTVFLPEIRHTIPSSPKPEDLPKYADVRFLKEALGVTPLFADAKN